MAQRNYVSLSKLGKFLENLNTKFAALTHKHNLSDISDFVVDSELSATSTNPVANSVLDAEFEAISTAMAVIEDDLDSYKENNDAAVQANTDAIAEITAIPDSEIIALFSS